MSGVDIVGQLLRDSQLMTAIVPAAWIKAGALPEGLVLSDDVPAVILLRSVSRTDWQPLSLGSMVRSIERVSVAVRARSYRDQREAITLVRRICPGEIAQIADCFRVSVRTAGRGPDLSGPGNSFEQTQDFRVSFDAPA